MTLLAEGNKKELEFPDNDKIPRLDGRDVAFLGDTDNYVYIKRGGEVWRFIKNEDNLEFVTKTEVANDMKAGILPTDSQDILIVLLKKKKKISYLQFKHDNSITKGLLEIPAIIDFCISPDKSVLYILAEKGIFSYTVGKTDEPKIFTNYNVYIELQEKIYDCIKCDSRNIILLEDTGSWVIRSRDDKKMSEVYRGSVPDFSVQIFDNDTQIYYKEDGIYIKEGEIFRKLDIETCTSFRILGKILIVFKDDCCVIRGLYSDRGSSDKYKLSKVAFVSYAKEKITVFYKEEKETEQEILDKIKYLFKIEAKYRFYYEHLSFADTITVFISKIKNDKYNEAFNICGVDDLLDVLSVTRDYIPPFLRDEYAKNGPCIEGILNNKNMLNCFIAYLRKCFESLPDQSDVKTAVGSILLYTFILTGDKIREHTVEHIPYFHFDEIVNIAEQNRRFDIVEYAYKSQNKIDQIDEHVKSIKAEGICNIQDMCLYMPASTLYDLLNTDDKTYFKDDMDKLELIIEYMARISNSPRETSYSEDVQKFSDVFISTIFSHNNKPPSFIFDCKEPLKQMRLKYKEFLEKYSFEHIVIDKALFEENLYIMAKHHKEEELVNTIVENDIELMFRCCCCVKTLFEDIYTKIAETLCKRDEEKFIAFINKYGKDMNPNSILGCISENTALHEISNFLLNILDSVNYNQYLELENECLKMNLRIKNSNEE